MLHAEHGLDVVGGAATAKEAFALVESESPDLVLLDLVLDRKMVFDLISETTTNYPATKVLVVSARDDVQFAPRCLQCGASGYFRKMGDAKELIESIHAVMRDEIAVSLEVQNMLLKNLNRPSKEPEQALSERELNAFQLIGEGRTTRQIAEEMMLSIKTVESYRERIKQKLNVENGSMLTRAAVAWVEKSAE